MARITIILKNGREADFDSSAFKLIVKDGKITSAEWARKDKGMSLLYADWSEVVAVTRDTSREE